MKSPLAAPWRLSNSLKRAQLQQIATLIGAPLTGTKPQLLDSIHETAIALQQSLQTKGNVNRSSRKQHELRVLSIDMGIRNLALAFLTTRVNHANATTTTLGKPVLHQWRRVSLTSSDDLFSELQSNGSELLASDSESDKVGSATMVESFEPNVMAGHAYTFAKYCASLNPTHILIERQRFRSGGHSAVQEWSLRVGMLEAMLYAIFQTLTAEKLLSNTTIEPMLPRRVNKYWFIDQDIPATGKHAKLAKIAIVNDMLRVLSTKDASFSPGTDVVEVVAGFGSKLPKGSAANKAVKSLNKLDDMSDALLQALAWLDWQHNRVKLINDGPEALGVDD